jgi:site-specific recombinase XerD
MSKNGFKKFKKNDYSYEEEEYNDKPRSHYLDRKKERRVQRALKVKDVSQLVEDEDLDDDNPHYITEGKY